MCETKTKWVGDPIEFYNMRNLLSLRHPWVEINFCDWSIKISNGPIRDEFISQICVYEICPILLMVWKTKPHVFIKSKFSWYVLLRV
jgi:hypothetical protein